MVILSHAIPLGAHPSGVLSAIRASCALGVPLFFILSAFLITELLEREKQKTSTVRLSAFYARRILRIWPLYFAALLGGMLVSRLPGMPHISMTELAAYGLLVGNWYAVLHGYLPFGLGPLWSIGVEEQFYLVWPSVVRMTSRRALWIVLGATWASSQIALAVFCARHWAISPVLWANTLTHAQYFADGAMISLWLRGKVPELPGSRRLTMFGAGIILLFLANYVFDTYRFVDPSSLARTFPGYFITGIGVVLMLLATLGASVPRYGRPAVWLGKISYGLYVYHLPIILLSVAIAQRAFHSSGRVALVILFVALPLTVGVAALSYKYLESPFLRFKERFEVVLSRTA
jgi:peptidoglycan/LPS O-acetylase OafA/YrhL